MTLKLDNTLYDSADTPAFKILGHSNGFYDFPYVNFYMRNVYKKHMIPYVNQFFIQNMLRIRYFNDMYNEFDLYTEDTTLDAMRYGYKMINYNDTTQKNSDGGTINGVPNEFINSFGNYVGLKYFLEGIKDHRDVHTYMDKIISHEDFELIKSLFKSCRYIYSFAQTEFEFYDENFGYAVIQISNSEKDRYKILCAIGFDEFGSAISSCGKSVKTVPMASWVTGVDSYGELEIKQFSIKDIHEYNHKFYPCMNGEDISSYAKRYMESNSSILLLIGPPGTAKTNFIRQLLSSTNESVLLTYSDDLKKADKLFSYFYDSPEKFLIIEDADTYIERREDGNSNMKQLLNITDGLTANPDKKVIFSTNLPSLTRVEPALLRPGRCFDKLEFGKLRGDHLAAAIEVIGEEHFADVETHLGFTIAELFAIKNNEKTDIVETSSKFGF